jgi:sulfatase modifying factor 1
VRLQGLVVVLVVARSLGGALACGSRTGVGIDEVGNDGGATCSGGSGPGLTNCGRNRENCCISLEVSGGPYYRTYANAGSGPTGQADPSTVSDFRLDKYLVTVGRFRRFVKAWNNGYYPANASGIHTYLNGGKGLENSGEPGGYETGWDAIDWNNTTDIDPTGSNLESCTPYNTWTDSPSGNENLPINCVTWYEAYAFCIWDGGSLPSEAEWEYAAAGGSQQREYPWGSTDPGTANQYAIYGDGDGVPSSRGYCYYPSGEVCSGVVNIAPVGTAIRGDGRWGQLDMAGDVAEWTLDGFIPTYVDPCVDCAYLFLGDQSYLNRVARGGAFDFINVFPWNRIFGSPTARVANYGLRCARTP